MEEIENEHYHLRPARYAKDKIAISCPSPDGWKTRAARLAENLSRGQYTNREKAYIMSKTKAAKFVTLFDGGWDASSIMGNLIEPK